MKGFVRMTSWKVVLAAAGIVALVAFHVYDRTPHYREIKAATNTVPADLVMTDELPPNDKSVKLKLIATERDGRPMKIYWLDREGSSSSIDIEPGKAGVLCEDGNLANGAEFVLLPGHYRLCFELTSMGLKMNARPFHVDYRLYEFR